MEKETFLCQKGQIFSSFDFLFIGENLQDSSLRVELKRKEKNKKGY